MCGIHVVLSTTQGYAYADHRDDGSGSPAGEPVFVDEVLRRRLCSRGPDHLGQVVSTYAGRLRLALTSTVLSLRGDSVARQPFGTGNPSGLVLCWNGEAWRLGATDVTGNDGQALFAALCSCLTSHNGDSDEARQDAVLTVLRAVVGPFTIVLLDQLGGRLYYARDRLGRRSLLLQKPKSDGLPQEQLLVLSSVAGTLDDEDPPWTEVATDGIYVVNLVRMAHEPLSDRTLADCTTRFPWSVEETKATEAAVIVSGIGPFNMATDPTVDPMTLGAESTPVWDLREMLTESLRVRVQNIPPPPLTSTGKDLRDTRVAVLFSGGVDCTVLARMAHDLVPAAQGIDLINVAFENPRVAAHLPPSADVFEACPDRITGRKSFAELVRACPGRAWRFIAANVPYTETVFHRPTIVALMHPHNTEMDLSIAAALYFAARGTGVCADTPFPSLSSPPYAGGTPARVLLSGLGADELFGGYGRHAMAFRRKGYAGVAEELRLDMARLGSRNLGRDDRVLSHWGREVRFPFLDEAFVRWAMGLPVWAKCDFAREAGDGIAPAKRVLRLVAASLGLSGAAEETKRAVGCFLNSIDEVCADGRSNLAHARPGWRAAVSRARPRYQRERMNARR